MDKKIRCVYRANLINRHSVREKEGRHDIWHDFSIPFLPSEHSGAMKLGMLKLIYFLIDRETNAFGGAKYRDRPSPFLFFFSFPQSWRRSRIFNPYFFHIHYPLPSLPFWKIDGRPREVGRNKSRVKVGEWGGERWPWSFCLYVGQNSCDMY